MAITGLRTLEVIKSINLIRTLKLVRCYSFYSFVFSIVKYKRLIFFYSVDNEFGREACTRVIEFTYIFLSKNHFFRLDDKHFCKPTDVAIASTGEFFVADGYCNSRIMKFDKEGKLLSQFGQPDCRLYFRGKIIK